ncbi:Cytochrome P450 [Amycolatopsis tolypomycina]|uniref:Cytochrome P450 n=1 Tax=Amycolatopsis tolypomycina TaxID=208445 RepID=A0A1H4NX57_9PSEU|nr:cytochrome P450 [Amycolatopsis tolypomycina]SEB99837.1 Cytochrome P450 [Amycolatopsis tolypomycina]
MDIRHPLLPVMRDGLDPHEDLVRLRRERPVAAFSMLGLREAWLVTRHDDVRTVLGDAGTFGNDLSLARDGAPVAGQWQPGGLGFHDSPVHTRRRRLLAPAFRAHVVRGMAPRIEDIVAAQLDRLARAGPPVDLVRALAEPVASGVMSALVGVPRACRRGRGTSRFELSGDLGTSVAAVGRSLDDVRRLVGRQRAGPRAGLLGRLLDEHGDQLDDQELAGLIDGLLTGGLDTTASMIATGCLVLLQDDRLAASVRGGAAPIDRVVDELLRYVCVAQLAFPRFARRDTSLKGQRIAAGDVVLCSLPTASRDPALGAAMDTVDPRRRTTPHLAFGFGVHRCLGAPLARLELRVVFSALLRRFPGLRLAVPAERVGFKRFSVIHGVESLPVTW